MNKNPNILEQNYEIDDLLEKKIKHEKRFNYLTITSDHCFKLVFHKQNLGMGEKRQKTTIIQNFCNQDETQTKFFTEIILSDPLNFNFLKNLNLDKIRPNDITNILKMNHNTIDEYLLYLKKQNLLDPVKVFDTKKSTNIYIKNTIFYSFFKNLISDNQNLYKNLIIPTINNFENWDGSIDYKTFNYIIHNEKKKLEDFFMHYRECLFSMINPQFMILVTEDNNLELDESKNIQFKYEYKQKYPPMLDFKID